MAFIDDNDDDNDVDLGFDVDDVKPSEGFQLLPPMDVNFDVVEIAVKATQAGDGKRLVGKIVITNENEYKGRKVSFGFNIVNPNEKAAAIGRSEAAALFASCGVGGSNASALLGKSGRCHIGVRKAKGDFDARNEIKRFMWGDKKDAAPAGPPKAAAPAAAPGEPVKRQPPKFAK